MAEILPPARADAYEALVEAMSERKEALRADADESIVPDRLVRADADRTTSSGNTADIERAQLSLIRTAIEADAGVTAEEALTRAGLNAEQFLQMSSQPGFFEGYKDLVKRTLVTVRYPRMILSLVSAAEAGDSRAFKVIEETLGGSMTDGLGEFAQAALHGDRKTVARMIDREVEELLSMKVTLEAEEEEQGAALAMIAETNAKAVESLG
jgi:hypothetical protein